VLLATHGTCHTVMTSASQPKRCCLRHNGVVRALSMRGRCASFLITFSKISAQSRIVNSPRPLNVHVQSRRGSHAIPKSSSKHYRHHWSIILFSGLCLVQRATLWRGGYGLSLVVCLGAAKAEVWVDSIVKTKIKSSVGKEGGRRKQWWWGLRPPAAEAD
jgi:hypothetical protein